MTLARKLRRLAFANSRLYSSRPPRENASEPLAAADVIYKNPGLAKEFPAEINPKKSIRLTTLYSSGEPGVERQFDPSTAAVTLRARVERVGLDSEEAVERLKELVSKTRYSERTKSISFTVKDFPLQALNKKRALEIFNELIAECKMQPTMAPEGEAATPSEANASEVKPLRRRRQISLAFPKEWLPKVAQ